MKYAQSDASGNINAYYDSTINSVAQIGSAITITDAQWLDCVNNPGKWTIVNGALQLAPAPTTAQLIAQQQQANIVSLQASYQTAINAPVTVKNTAGITSTYAFGNTLTHGGTNAQALLTQILSAGSTAWTAGVWFDVVGVAQTMTFADLQGLAAAVEAAETPDEQHLMVKIAAVQAQTALPYVGVLW